MKQARIHCPYCGSLAMLRPASAIHGLSDISAGTYLYVCRRWPACDAYVTADRRTKQPLGTLANGDQEGCVWLCNAALTFDPARGSFASYARQVVQNGLVSYCRNLTGKQSRMISLAEMEPTALAALEVQHSAPFDIECETPLLLAAAESQYSGVTRKGVHALALQVSGIPLTAVATRMSAPPNHVSAWISRAVHKLRNDESFLSSLHEN